MNKPLGQGKSLQVLKPSLLLFLKVTRKYPQQENDTALEELQKRWNVSPRVTQTAAKQGFSPLALVTFGARPLCRRGLCYALQDTGQHPGLYPLDASLSPSRGRTKNASRHRQMSPGVRTHYGWLWILPCPLTACVTRGNRPNPPPPPSKFISKMELTPQKRWENEIK